MSVELSQTSKASKIPWIELFRQTLSLIKSSDATLVGFLAAYFLISLLGQVEEFDWRTATPGKLWLWASTLLVLAAASYFVFVVFIHWIQTRYEGQKEFSLRGAVESTSKLMIPLTILSIRGALLFVAGLIFLIIPGLYFSFKYELASFCLILEGWHDEAPPITRAKQLIVQYRFSLLLIAIIMILEWIAPWILEELLRLGDSQMGWGLRCGIAIIESAITIVVDVYVTLTVIFLLKNARNVGPSPN